MCEHTSNAVAGFGLILVVVSTVATPGEWQCKIRTGGVRRLAVANGHFSNASCYDYHEQRIICRQRKLRTSTHTGVGHAAVRT